MRFTYEAVLEINDTMAAQKAVDGIDAIIKEATKNIDDKGKPIEIPKEFYKLVLFKIAHYYGIEIACM